MCVANDEPELILPEISEESGSGRTGAELNLPSNTLHSLLFAQSAVNSNPINPRLVLVDASVILQTSQSHLITTSLLKLWRQTQTNPLSRVVRSHAVLLPPFNNLKLTAITLQVPKFRNSGQKLHSSLESVTRGMMDSLRLEASSTRACKLKDWTCMHGLKSQSAVSFSCESGNHQSCLVCFRRHGECRGCAVPEGSKSEEYKMLKWRKGYGSSVEQSLRKCPFPRCREYMISSEEEHHMKICVLRPFTCTEPYRCGRQCENPVPYLEILRHLIEYHSLEVRVVWTNQRFTAETKEEILVPALVCKGHPERYAPKLFQIHGRYFLRKIAVIERKCVFYFCLADGCDQEAKNFQLIVKICHGENNAQVVWDTRIPCLRTAEELDQHFSKSTEVPISKHAFSFDCFPVQNVKQRSTAYSFHYTVVDGLEFQPDASTMRLMRPPPVSVLELQYTGLTSHQTSILQEIESLPSPSVVGITSIAPELSSSESDDSMEIEPNLATVSQDSAAQTRHSSSTETDEDVPPVPKRQIIHSNSRVVEDMQSSSVQADSFSQQQD